MYKCLGDEWLIFKNACSLPPASGAKTANNPFLAVPDSLLFLPHPLYFSPLAPNPGTLAWAGVSPRNSGF